MPGRVGESVSGAGLPVSIKGMRMDAVWRRVLRRYWAVWKTTDYLDGLSIYGWISGRSAPKKYLHFSLFSS